MPFVEIIYEPGNKSVAFYDDEEEMKSALMEHHRRAVSGEPATPKSDMRNDLETSEMRIGTWPAERIKRALIYDTHPAEFNSNQVVDKEELTKLVSEAVDATEMEGLVHVHTVAAAVRDMSSPIAITEHPHDSQFKMPEDDELDLAFLKEVE